MKRWGRSVWALVLVMMLVLVACGGDSESGSEASGETTTPASLPDAPTESGTLRLGYFPNITHATGIIGVEKGFIADELGSQVKLETSSFNAGPAAVEALFSGALDATYIGPNPAINAFAQSNGEAIRIISGATSGGAFFVVSPDITSAEDLAGKKIATPQLGNTQDVALRTWLKEQGYETDEQGGGEVSIVPQENAQTLETFKSGDIDGAWVPEPWATRLQQEGGGKVLVDEADLWPDGQYVTTHLIVRTEFLKERPDIVVALLRGHLAAEQFIADNEAEAQKTVNDGIEKLTGKRLKEETITAAWPNLEFTNDPIAGSLKKDAEDAEALGLLEPVDLDGIYDLSYLNALLEEQGQAPVEE